MDINHLIKLEGLKYVLPNR